MPNISLTENQLAVLVSIEEFIKKYGFSPTYAELAEIMGWHPNAAFECVRNLTGKGILAVTPKTARSIRVLIPSNKLKVKGN